MTILCGTDIIEISRIKNAIEGIGQPFVNKIYTDKEIQYCESKKVQKYQHYAARFAAKEATFKAISKKLDSKYEIEWKDIEIQNDEQGRPSILLHHSLTEKITNMDLSISHCNEYAVANVVVVFE